MFEQELYNQQASEVRTQPGDLFHGYEIRNWNLTPRLYKILAISAIFNIFTLLFVGQAELLTRRGCESPFVGRVCQVLDTVYVGSLIFGTDREYVDAPYEKTDLGEAEVTFVDVTGVTPPLTYPEGYFQLANPEQQFANVTDPMAGFSGNLIPGIPTNPTIRGGGLINTPAYAPPKNPNAIEGDLPTGSPLGEVNDPGGVVGNRKGRRGGQLPANTEPEDANVAAAGNTNTGNTNSVSSSPLSSITINREVMNDLGKRVAEQVTKDGVNLTSNFKVTAIGVLNAEGKFDTSIDKKTKLPKSRVLTGEGDPAMVKIATEAIAAVGDSGWLGYLRMEGIEKLNFSVYQTDDVLVIDVTSEHLTPERAKSVSSRLNNAVSAPFIANDLGLRNLSDDEKVLLKAATATSAGKFVVLNFKIPKAVAQEMITRNLQKAREAATGKKESRKLENVPDDERSAKK